MNEKATDAFSDRLLEPVGITLTIFCSDNIERDYSEGYEQNLPELRSGAEVTVAARLAGLVGGGHLALFISDMVDELDLSAIVGSYESGDGRGRPPYHPLMMVKLLV